MTESGEGSFSADTDVGFDGSQDVSVTYVFDDEEGDPGAHLQLSHCESGPTGGTGGTPPPGGTGGTPPPGGTGGVSGATTGSGGVQGGTTGGTTGGVAGAQAAAQLPFTGLPVWMPLLLGLGLLGLGYVLLRRKARTSA
jgi:hypothetical protein